MDEKQLKKVANICKLKLTPEEEKEFLKQFDEIFDYFSMIDKVRKKVITEDIDYSEFRKDDTSECKSKDIVKNFPYSVKGKIKVPRVL